MTHVLGGGMSSRLFQTVRERNGLCYSIYAHHAGFDDTGLFAIATATRPEGRTQSHVLAFKEFRKMASKRVAADELAAAKSAMVGRLLRSTETAIASARFYGSRWRAGLPLETPDDRAEAIMKVTAAEVQSIAEEIASGIGDGSHGAGGTDRPGRRAALSDRVRQRRTDAAAFRTRAARGRDDRPRARRHSPSGRGGPGARGSATCSRALSGCHPDARWNDPDRRCAPRQARGSTRRYRLLPPPSPRRHDHGRCRARAGPCTGARRDRVRREPPAW